MSQARMERPISERRDESRSRTPARKSFSPRRERKPAVYQGDRPMMRGGGGMGMRGGRMMTDRPMAMRGAPSGMNMSRNGHVNMGEHRPSSGLMSREEL